MNKWWMIRAGDDNELIPMWLDKGIASIGWERFGNPKIYHTKSEFLKVIQQKFSENKPQSINSWVSQVWRFSHEIKVEIRFLHIQRKKESI